MKLDWNIYIIKRNGNKVPFDRDKLKNAIYKAIDNHKELYHPADYEIEDISDDIETIATVRFEDDDCMNVEEIQDLVEAHLMKKGYYGLAREYIKYRYTRKLSRDTSELEESIMNLIHMDNEDVQDENSNKKPTVIYTQRDLIAGETSKFMSKKLTIPHYVVDAHEKGQIHFHDMDYYIQPSFNCCLVNIRDMFNNSTVINDKMIEKPNSFQTACTVMTQIITAVSSSQYGGTSVDIGCLGEYLKISEDKHRRRLMKSHNLSSIDELTEQDKKDIQMLTRYELESGIQTIQYQINTMATTNGQSPFVTLFMYLKEDDPYIEYTAQIFEEMFKQRILGIKNKVGIYISPSFPKLVYVLSPLNNFSGGKYDYITKIACECVAKRMMPDFISEKKMKENYGDVFSPMGCRSFLSPWKDENGEYKWEGRFNSGVVSINLPQLGLIARGDMDYFWKLFDDRLKLCKEALLVRHKHLRGVTSDVSPIHWQYGCIARLKPGETIDKYLFGGYSTLSLGYIGLYELTNLMTGKTHTDLSSEQFAVDVIQHMKDKVLEWKAGTNIGFALYGTPRYKWAFY